MTRVLRDHIKTAERKLARLKRAQKQAIVAKIFREQPHLLSFVASLSECGPSRKEIEFLYHLLVVCYQAMQESGGSWAVVRESDREQLLRLMMGEVDKPQLMHKSDNARDHEAEQTEHPERFLRSYAQQATEGFMAACGERGDARYLAAAARTIVDAIAVAGAAGLQWHQSSVMARSAYSPPSGSLTGLSGV